MHADEIETDVTLVRRLVTAQFPRWADLAIVPVVSYGMDHDIYRLGDRLAVRLPRIGWATKQAAKEADWLPKLAPHLPLAIPVQLAIGEPAEGYPFAWSVSRPQAISRIRERAAQDRCRGSASAPARQSRRTTCGTGRGGSQVDLGARRPNRRRCRPGFLGGVPQCRE